MALGILMILFAVMSAASITGLSLMFAVKNERDRRTVFYCMAVWGMFIAAFGAMSLPANFLAQRASAWGIGILSLAAAKSPGLNQGSLFPGNVIKSFSNAHTINEFRYL